MIFTARADGRFELAGAVLHCALGRSGVAPASAKREGDGATPAGTWPLRRVLFRADRGGAPATALATQAVWPHDGWCDDPADRAYNRQVTLPHDGHVEELWRDDHLYDLIVVLGFNDEPVVSGAGSAIFLHVARPDLGPTEGCVALAEADLRALLSQARPGDALEIRID